MQRVGGLLKTNAWYSNDVKLLKETSFGHNLFLNIEAVPPPFLPPLVENKKLKLGGQASVRTIEASVPSHVSVKRRMSKLLSKIRSWMINDLFKSERTFSTAILVFVPSVRSSSGSGEMGANVTGVKLMVREGNVLWARCEILTGMQDMGVNCE